MNDCDVIIIGSGTAGLAAGLYSGRYNLRTIIFGGDFGGETAKAGVIWNYPGARGVDGFDLMMTMKLQAEESGAKIFDEDVDKIEKTGNLFNVFAGGEKFTSKSIIFSTGTKRKRLGLPNEEKLTGRGVHYCVTCDGAVYVGKTIAMVGGGDASLKGVILAATYVNKIFLIARASTLTGEPVNIEAIKKLGSKVEIIFNTEVKEIVGADRLEKLVLSKSYNDSPELVVDGMFVEIGAKPNTDLAQLLGVSRDASGNAIVDNTMSTNIPGVFVAGDSTAFFGGFKQCITAAAMGSVAANSAFEYIRMHF